MPRFKWFENKCLLMAKCSNRMIPQSSVRVTHSGKYPCGVCQSGVGSSNAIFCDGCKRWVHKKCSGIKGPLRPDPEFRCARCLGTPWAIDEREVSEVEVGNEKLEVVPEFCYLGDMLSAGGGCDHMLQMCMGQVPPIASPSHQPPSAPSDQR